MMLPDAKMPVLLPTLSIALVMLGALGATVSTVKSNAPILGPSFDPSGVSEAVNVWRPSLSAPGVKLHWPEASVATEPFSTSPS